MLGTFAIYQRAVHTPDESEMARIEQFAHLASIAIERRAAADRIRLSEAHYRLLTEDASDVVWKLNSNLEVTYISPADQRMRGYRSDEVTGHHIFELFTEEGIATVKKAMQPDVQAGPHTNLTGPIRFEVQQRCKDGSLVWTEILSTRELDAHANVTGHHGITRNITERKEAQELVRRLAFYDVLTKLANRRLFNDRLSQALILTQREQSRFALLFIDLDKFKPINDEHGHETGDRMLQAVARRIESCLRASDTAARIGGDEFVVILPDMQTPGAALAVAEKIRVALQQPLLTSDNLLLNASCSIGVAMYPDHGNTEQDLLRLGDNAMYNAKKAGGNRVEMCALGAETPDIGEVGASDQSIIRLTWKAAFACGNPSIDREHRELFRLSNLLLGMVATRATAPAQFNAAFDALLQQVRQHLANEEAILAKHGYAPIQQHAEQHQALLARALDLRDRADTLSVGDLVEFMVSELVARHMLLEDRKFFALFADSPDPV